MDENLEKESAESKAAKAAEKAEAEAEARDSEMPDPFEELKLQAEKAKEEYENATFTKFDVVRDIIGFFVIIAIAFGWMMLMLLIVSFVTVSYLHFTFDGMLIASGIVTAVIGIVYIIRKAFVYNGLLKKREKNNG